MKYRSGKIKNITAAILAFSFIFPIAFGFFHSFAVDHSPAHFSGHQLVLEKPGLNCNHLVFFNLLSDDDFSPGIAFFIPGFNRHKIQSKKVLTPAINRFFRSYRGPPSLMF